MSFVRAKREAFSRFQITESRGSSPRLTYTSKELDRYPCANASICLYSDMNVHIAKASLHTSRELDSGPAVVVVAFEFCGLFVSSLMVMVLVWSYCVCFCLVLVTRFPRSRSYDAAAWNFPTLSPGAYRHCRSCSAPATTSNSAIIYMAYNGTLFHSLSQHFSVFVSTLFIHSLFFF